MVRLCGLELSLPKSALQRKHCCRFFSARPQFLLGATVLNQIDDDILFGCDIDLLEGGDGCRVICYQERVNGIELSGSGCLMVRASFSGNYNKGTKKIRLEAGSVF